MTYFTCERTWEAMLSCIYEAFCSKKGHKNIKLVFEPVDQYTLFDEYIHVDADDEKVDKVMDVICTRISQSFYQDMMFVAMSNEPDVMDNIYRCIILGLNYGPSSLEMVQYWNIMRHQEIKKRVANETYRFQEIMRFHLINGGIYVAHFEPKHRVAVALGPIFQDRMPSEHWMIVDDINRVAVIHPKDEEFYVRQLDDYEFNRLLETEEENDGFTDLWKVFFDTIAIKERTNPKCQMSHFPLWARKHAIEFATVQRQGNA